MIKVNLTDKEIAMIRFVMSEYDKKESWQLTDRARTVFSGLRSKFEKIKVRYSYA